MFKAVVFDLYEILITQSGTVVPRAGALGESLGLDATAAWFDTACGFSLVERIEVPTSTAVTVPCARRTKRIDEGFYAE
jgi:hypothetical protein